MKSRRVGSFRSYVLRISAISLILAGISGITAVTPASARPTNPTPVCAGAYCTITFATASDYYLWTVPAGITSLTVDVRGSSGGTGTNTSFSGEKAGGFGAKMIGTLTATPGGELRVVAGGMPAAATGRGGGGGGGASYIALNSPLTPYVVAGGGGGGPGACCTGATRGVSASLTTSGTSSSSNSSAINAGGINGNGGAAGTSNSGGSGAGWITGGLVGWTTGTVATALSSISGGTGGTYSRNCANYLGGTSGGFGGGGAACGGGGGGGGGYSGGGSSGGVSNWGGGGGGGSYTIATSPSNAVLTSAAAGSVEITYLNAPTPTTFSTTQASPTNSTSAFTYSIVMSQNITGMENADFTNAGTATGCTFAISDSSGTSFTLTASSCGEGTVIPQLLTDSVYGTVTATNGPGSNAQAITPVTIDRTSPTISSVTAPANATYIPAGQLNFTANMSEATIVTTSGGTPYLALTIGSTARNATYVSGSGTSALVFRYTVATDINNIDTDGIAVATTINLNGATMADAAINNAVLTFAAPTLTSVLVAQVPGAPTITAITTTSSALSIAFTAGETNGSAITTYKYSLNSGAWITRATGTTASPIAITGLPNGTAYTVAIRAFNAAGEGAASTTSAAVTVNAPLAITSGGNLTTTYGVAASVTFSSTNGTGAKTFTIRRTSDDGQQAGITINSSTGVITVDTTLVPSTYGMTVTVTDATNATSSTTMNVVVNGGIMTITAASPSTIAYGGNKTADTFTTTNLNSADSINGLTYTYSGAGLTIYAATTVAPTAAGTYSITPSAVTFTDPASAGKYATISYLAGSFTITKAVLTVTPTSGQSISYGAIAALDFSVTGFSTFSGAQESAASAAGYLAPTCSASSYSRLTSNAATIHTISCAGGSATNYTFTTTATATATVTKAILTVTPAAKSVTYGDVAPILTFVVNGWQNSQTAANAADYIAPTCSASSYSRTSPALTPVTISCSNGTANNYSFDITTTASISIAKLGTLTITAASPSAINYGAATPANSFSTSGKATDDLISTVTYSYAGTGSTSYSASASAPTLPGTYSITPSAASFSAGAATNYTTVSYVAGNYTINNATLTITAASPSTIAYGGNKTADTFTTTNLNSADSINGLTYTYSGAGLTIYAATTVAPTAAGTYSITPSAVTFTDPASAGKYATISYLAGSFTITKAVLTVTPTSGQSISYGAIAALDFSVTGFSTFSGAQESAASAAGYLAPTCSASSYSRLTSNAATIHTISCAGGSATNYTFTTTATATATVTKAILTVTPAAKSVTYGDVAPILTFVVNGWQNSQTAANAADYIAPTCSASSYSRTSPALTPVTISCSNGTANNYSFDITTTASISIAKLGTLTITAASPSAINYGAATPANSFSTSGKATDDLISTVTYSYAGTGSTSYSASASAPTLPGTYSITPSAASFSAGAATNYTTVSYVAGNYTINNATLVISVVPQIGVVYGAVVTDTFTTTNLNSADSINGLTYTYSGAGLTIYAATTVAPTTVGTYAITPSGASFASDLSAARYGSISYTSGALSIVKAPLQLVLGSATVIYGSQLPALTFTATGLQLSQTLPNVAGYVAPSCSSTYTTTTQVALSPVSSTCSGGSATNYSFVSATSNNVTITQRALTVTGTTIASRAFNGITNAGSITRGAVSGYAIGESLPISASATNYSASSAGVYSTTVTYSLSNNADSAKGIANNYTIGSSTLSGEITQAEPGFIVALSQGATTMFSLSYGNAETLVVTATTATPGTVNFKVSINDGTATDITGCSAVTVTAGAAVCPWVTPTIGKARITISLTASDSANQAVAPKVIDTLIVAQPFITSFQVKNQPGVTSGAAGTVVIITGGNFTGITQIKFNGLAAEKTFRATRTQATVTVPFGATTGQITIVTLLGGAGTSSTNFTVTG